METDVFTIVLLCVLAQTNSSNNTPHCTVHKTVAECGVKGKRMYVECFSPLPPKELLDVYILVGSEKISRVNVTGKKDPDTNGSVHRFEISPDSIQDSDNDTIFLCKTKTIRFESDYSRRCELRNITVQQCPFTDKKIKDDVTPQPDVLAAASSGCSSYDNKKHWTTIWVLLFSNIFLK